MSPVIAQTLVEELTGFDFRVRQVIGLFLELLAVWFVATTWLKTKSVAPTVGALLLGALVVWGVENDEVIIAAIKEDTGSPTEVDSPSGRGPRTEPTGLEGRFRPE